MAESKEHQMQTDGGKDKKIHSPADLWQNQKSSKCKRMAEKTKTPFSKWLMAESKEQRI